MKKFYILLLGFVFSIAVYGQEQSPGSFGKNHFPQKENGTEIQRKGSQKFRYQQQKQSFLKNASQDFQRLDSLLEYIWDGEEWLLDYEEEYTYNENGLIVRYEGFSMDELSDEWMLDDKEEYEYNEAGNLTLLYDYEPDSASQQWFASFRVEYYYNDSNLLTQYDESWKDAPDEEWYYVWRTTFTYDENGKPISSLEYFFSLLGWSPAGSSEYSYDENGNLTKYEEFDDDDAGGQVNDNQVLYMYDDNNRIIERTEYDWDEISVEYIETDRDVFSYAENNNVESLTDYNWSEEENDWVEFFRSDYTYDNNYPNDQLILPWFYHDDNPNYMNHQLVEFQNFSFVDSEWVPFSRGDLYYSSEPSTNVSDVDKIAVRFYPNPADREITFEFDFSNVVHLQIYNLSGNLIQSQQVQSNKPVNIEQLAGGLYLFRLVGKKNELIYTDKLLVN